MRRTSEIDAVAAENRCLIESVGALLVLDLQRSRNVVQVGVGVSQTEPNECLTRLKTGDETIGSVAARAVARQTFAVDQAFEFDFEFTRAGEQLIEKKKER